jgi:hypothetical protein
LRVSQYGIDERTDQDLIRAFVKELEYSDEIAQTTPETSTRAIANGLYENRSR